MQTRGTAGWHARCTARGRCHCVGGDRNNVTSAGLSRDAAADTTGNVQAPARRLARGHACRHTCGGRCRRHDADWTGVYDMDTRFAARRHARGNARLRQSGTHERTDNVR